ncbi:MAG: hypothetical protein K0R12_1197 [Gammaproteobacteria bacterium]|jgi:hypothetical protein|nr:hypothetical protein [Gammaproteobacteria bacterium]
MLIKKILSFASPHSLFFLLSINDKYPVALGFTEILFILVLMGFYKIGEGVKNRVSKEVFKNKRHVDKNEA